MPRKEKGITIEKKQGKLHFELEREDSLRKR
jgi:hypothetical protein